MKPFVLSILAVLSLSLVACGGGGGGGPIPTPIQSPPVHTSSVAVHSGFQAAQKTTASRVQYAKVMAITPQDVTLGSQIVPSVDFVVAPSYLANMGTATNAQLVAYLSTSDGTTNGITSDTIAQANSSLVVAQTGNPITQSSPQPVSTTVPSPMPSPGIPVGGAVLGTPSNLGVTTFTVTANVNGVAQTSTNQAFSYSGLCLATTNDDQDAPANTTSPHNCPQNGVTFDATGATQPATDTSTADVYLTYSGNVTSATCPNGGVIVTGNIDSVTTNVPTITQGKAFTVTVSLTPTKGLLSPGNTLVCYTLKGQLFKYDYEWQNSNGTAGNIEETYGFSNVAAIGATTFAY